MFENFYGNQAAVSTLEQMIAHQRIPQTILIAGPEGVGKATLVRRFAAKLIGDAAKIEKDDLSRPENIAAIADRDKWPSDKRVEDPLVFSTHPDFLTFPPEGPLRQISISQMRLLKARAQFTPLKGQRRVFLIDRIDRANEQAANSLLKTLEEPPDHMIIMLTAENAYDLLPTIRSRSVPIYLGRLTPEELQAFGKARNLDNSERRLALSKGSPGLATSIDLEVYDKRRAAMLALLQVAAKRAPFAKWLKYSESLGSSKTEKLEYYLNVLYILLEDLLILQQGATPIRNTDIEKDLAAIAPHITFPWIRTAVSKVDELTNLLRRNIQKSIALDALIVELQSQ